MVEVALVHHDTGEEGRRAVERLARTVEALLGGPSRVRACPVSGLASCSGPCDLGVALFIGRGGHFHDAVRGLSRACARVAGPIPGWIVAVHVARALEGAGLGGTVYLVYHEARRWSGEHAGDYESVAVLASRLLERAAQRTVRVRAVGRGEARRLGVRGYLLTVMPGPGERISVLGGDPGFSLVAGWILGLLGRL